FVPSAFTLGSSNVTFSVVPATSTSPSNDPSSVVDAAHGVVCVIVNSKSVLGMTTSLSVLPAGRSITKLPIVDASVKGKVCGLGVSVVDGCEAKRTVTSLVPPALYVLENGVAASLPSIEPEVENVTM